MVIAHNNKNRMNGIAHKHARRRPLHVAIQVAMAGGIAAGALPATVQAVLPSPAAAWSQLTGTTYRFGTTTATFSDRALNIDQRDSKVVLDWESFDIGSGHTVTFHQPGADAVAINKVVGADPSRIFGNLNANGQVYLINTNGILFGAGAQVNVRTLVASTLDMTQEALEDGILAPNQGNAGRPAFDGAGTGSVNIQAGAVLRADGGRVLVFAPEITNEGLIQTPDGQTVLAAGQKIYISSVEVGDTANPELIGQLLVEVDVSGVPQEALQAFLRGESATLPAGTATNRGVIEALRGNVSMAGLAVNQHGRVSATTSVRQNGSIRLVASDRSTAANDPARGGRVQLGEHSKTEIALELRDDERLKDERGDFLQPIRPIEEVVRTEYAQRLNEENARRQALNLEPLEKLPPETAVDADSQEKSSIRIAAHSVHLEKNSEVWAPAGKVEISANAEGATAPGLANVPTNDSRVHIAAGARIDVSGANIAMPVSSNLLEVELRGAQLQDSPYQRNGILRNATVVVDMRQTGVREDGTEWVGTPLADLHADVAAVGKTVGERSLEGGTVSIASQGDALIEQGSEIDVSGGAIQYLDDGMTTTRLVSNGRVYDIADAPEDLRYDQVLTTFTKDYKKWGVRRVWNLFPNRSEPGYLQGFDAGTFQLIAARGALEGRLLGGVVVGPKQRGRAPQGGEFVFGLPPNAQLTRDFDLRSPDIVFTAQKRLNALLAGGFNVYGGALPADFDSFHIDPQLFGEDGMHRGRIYSNGRILLPGDVNLVLPAGGSLALTAGQIDIQGGIVVPGGDIALETRDTLTLAAELARIDIGARARLDTRGTWTNDNPFFDPVLGPVFRNGGSVTVVGNGGAGVFLAGGSAIDVSGGAWLDAGGHLLAGDAGSIDLRAVGTGEAGIVPPRLVMDATLAGYALGTGGSLRLDAPQVCIGATACAAADALRIAPQRFQQGGFNRYSVNANQGGLTVARDALIRPLAESWLLAPGFAFQPTGADLVLFTRRVILPDIERAPATLTLSANAKSDGGFGAANFADAGHLDLQAGSRIVLDPRSTVNLSSNTRLHLAGSIVAPAGTITATLTNGLALTGYIANQAIHVDATASLDVRGVAQMQADAFGRRQGEVHDGGRIELTAQRGYIVTGRGAQLDVSGTSATLDLPERNGTRAQTVAGAAGSIVFTAAEGMLLDGAMNAAAGGAGAAGGELRIALDANNRDERTDSGFLFPDAARSVRVADGGGAQVPAGFSVDDPAAFAALNGQARIAEARIGEGGFDRVQLVSRNLLRNNAVVATGEVRLDDGVRLAVKRDIRIDAAALSTPGSAELNAASVALGSTDRLSQAVAATTAGTGSLNVNADLIDVIGHSRIQDAAAIALNSTGDLRLRGVQVQNGLDISGSLTSDGDLSLRADQVYPTTLSDFTLEVTGVDGTLSILPGDGNAAPVLSAGGALHLRADNVEQHGTLRAPIGELDLVAGERLVLGDGSLTSTSADGATIPFGRIEAGEDWVYALQEKRFRVYTGNGAQPLPQKQVTLDGADIDVRDGATVDLSGGGDLLAYEFVPGVDGTRDILDPELSPDSYAILPDSGLNYAPYDAQEMAGSNLQAGDSVYLSGIDGLEAGIYTLLPARYALLPGAWLVTAVDGHRDLPNGQSIAQPNGSTLVSGYRTVAGTDIRDSRTSGFALRRGSDLKQFARYDTATANAFFPDAAQRNDTATPRLPGDAGTLAIAPRNSLRLEGSLRASAVHGARGSAVDIAADLLAVTGGGAAGLPAGFVQIDAAQLSAFGAESLLLGALRERGAEQTALDVRAREVRVSGDVDLTVPDLVIAARERIDVAGGAALTAAGSARTGDAVLRADGDGALLRLSADEQVHIDRGAAADGAQGDLIIGAGAQLTAAQSAVLDATRDTQSQGDLIMDGGSLNIGAYRISLGDAAGVSEGLVLGNDALRQAQVDELVLTSRKSVDIYGGLNLQVNDLHIEAAGIRGYANSGQTARIDAAGDITLSNREGVSDTDPATGDGHLQLHAADRIALGETVSDTAPEAVFAIEGFAQTALSAGREIVGDGTGTLEVAGDLTLNAPRITATKGADTTIRAQDAADVWHRVSIAQPGTRPADLPLADLGARLNIEASRIEHGGNIELNAGLLTLAARGEGSDDGVRLQAGSSVDLSGRTVVFDGVSVHASAGKLAATAAHGDVTLDGDIDLSAPAGGGDAGRLTASAAGGALSIGGTVRARAGNGGRGGEARLDADVLGDFSALNATLNDAGFSAQRDLRQRSGDIHIAMDDTVTAQDIQITADSGAITVAGALNASGDAGGRIQLNADQDLHLAASARLDAHAADGAGDGGRVDLRSQSGGVSLDGGSVIDVRGGADGRGGEVQLRLPRGSVLSVLDADGANDQMQLAATILGAAQRLIEGHQVYTEADGTIDAAQVGTGSVWYADAQSFIAAAAGAAAAAGDAEFVTRPGIEIRSPGDLTLTADWNLNAWRFDGQPGVLTLRAGGDLNIGSPTAANRSSAGALSDGFATATTTSSTVSVVLPGPSWSYRLVAGSDQSSADLLGVRASDDLPDGGDFKLANGTYSATAPQTRVVRTGSGDIDIAAAQDFILGNAASVVYTAGEPSGGVKLSPLGMTREYPDGGGDVRVRAGRDARGVEGNQLISNWLFRAGNASTATGWTVVYERFQQGIGALGGGDVWLSAGRDIDNLSAVIPSIGRQVGGTTRAASEVEVVGGGDLSVEAGNDIASGVYYVGKGTAEIRAGGALESNRTSSSGPIHTVLALGDGTFDVQARGDLDLETVFNPTMAPPSSANAGFTSVSYFFTYAPDSAVNLRSTAGDVVFNNGFERLKSAVTGVNWTNYNVDVLGIYAPTLTTQALGGDVQFNGPNVWLYPAPKSNLEVYADGNVNFAANMRMVLSDIDPDLLPIADNPSSAVSNTLAAFLGKSHASIPIHALDNQPDGLADDKPVHIVARTGDIAMDEGSLGGHLTFSKAVRLSSGRDLRDLQLFIQNVAASDVSSLVAGRDLIYSTVRTVDGALSINPRSIEVDGPGRLDVLAGRHVDLGTSGGVKTNGNLYNGALSDEGASVMVLAGATAPAIEAFVEAYPTYFVADEFASRFRAAIAAVAGGTPSDTETALAVYAGLDEEAQAEVLAEMGLPERYASGVDYAELQAILASADDSDNRPRYLDGFYAETDKGDDYFSQVHALQTRMIDFVRNFTGEALGNSEALQRFRTLDTNLQRQFVVQAMFNELKWSGRVEARTGNNEYPAGFQAVETLFPHDDYVGDIRMTLSTVRTLDGGDIDLLAPGGRINAGLSTPPASLGKTDKLLGVVAVASGDVRVFADDDIQVEESRIFTGDGGDIVAWSSNGNVDAGRGSKAALSVPPPIITFNDDGTVTIVASNSLQGSGIRAFASSEGTTPGDVDLFAPRGVVNAGDAGIGGGNITLGATAILGADNIDVGGISVGVPVADTGSLAAGLTGISNLSSSVSKMAEESASSLGGNEDALSGGPSLGFLSVDILGFGE